MPQVKGILKDVAWRVWDGVLLGGSDVTASLFGRAFTGASITKFNTNMRQPNKFPDPERFTIDSIGFAFLPDIDPTNSTAFLKGSFELYCGSKVYLHRWLDEFPASGGIHVAPYASPTLTEGTPNTFAAGTYYGNNGEPDKMSQHMLPISIDLEVGEIFRVDITWDAAPGAFTVYAFMDGVLWRPGQ